LVATPIGNLEDITLRALRVLRECDVVAAEDTRHTGQLLRHYGIQKSMVSYFRFNEARRSSELIERLKMGGKVALVTDAGSPGSAIRASAWWRPRWRRGAGWNRFPEPAPWWPV
jgi:16S rRNA (cytidine1402-2'-O)-methyltransferase